MITFWPLIWKQIKYRRKGIRLLEYLWIESRKVGGVYSKSGYTVESSDHTQCDVVRKVVLQQENKHVDLLCIFKLHCV